MTLRPPLPALLLIILGIVCFTGAVAMADAGGCGESSTLAEMGFYGLFGAGFVATGAGVYTSLRLDDALRALAAFLTGLSAVFATFLIAVAVSLSECLS